MWEFFLPLGAYDSIFRNCGMTDTFAKTLPPVYWTPHENPETKHIGNAEKRPDDGKTHTTHR